MSDMVSVSIFIAIVLSADIPDYVRQRALEATVRVRVGTGPRFSYGTGVIVGRDVDGGHLILTARHVPDTTSAHVVIDAFCYDGSKGEVVKADRRVVGISRKGDVALLKLTTSHPVPVGIPVRPRSEPLPPGRYSVLSVGCDGGNDPTCWTATGIVGRSRDGSGAGTILTTREPRQGRSGGPLVDDKGQVVGICSAGGDGEGVFVGLAEIQRFLAASGYGNLVGDAGQAGQDITNPEPDPEPSEPPRPAPGRRRGGLFGCFRGR